MLHQQPHIVLLEEDEKLTITIDDVKVFDFVEDYLIEECDLEYESYINPTANVHRMVFDKRYAFEELQKALLNLDRNEIERVYRGR